MARLARLFRRDASNGAVIRTERLVLRSLEDRDITVIARLAGDWDVASMTARVPYPYTQDDARQWLDHLEPGEVVYAIDREGEMIGLTGFLPSEDGASAEIGYWIGKPFWGHGYATEAATALIRRCFAQTNFTHLTCCHFTDNPASGRVVEKLGFALAGSCSCWCEARRREAPALHYVMHKPRGLRRGFKST